VITAVIYYFASSSSCHVAGKWPFCNATAVLGGE